MSVSTSDFHFRFDIDADPNFFAVGANADFAFTQGSFDFDRPITTCDGLGAASNVAAGIDRDLLAEFGQPVFFADEADKERSFEQNVFFEG